MSEEEKKRMQEQKKVKKGLKNQFWGQILLAIPKNLLKISILVVFGAFLSMLWLINNDSSLNEFLSLDDEMYDFTKDQVHPLFYEMQKYIVKDDIQTLQQMTERKYVRQIGDQEQMKEFYKEGFIRAKTQEITKQELTTKVFYRSFLSQNRPVKVLDGAKGW